MLVPGFSIEPIGFWIFPVFKSFSIFAQNQTGLKASSQLNYLDQLVWSGFEKHSFEFNTHIKKDFSSIIWYLSNNYKII